MLFLGTRDRDEITADKAILVNGKPLGVEVVINHVGGLLRLIRAGRPKQIYAVFMKKRI